jgi:hypothetical protein
MCLDEKALLLNIRNSDKVEEIACKNIEKIFFVYFY